MIWRRAPNLAIATPPRLHIDSAQATTGLGAQLPEVEIVVEEQLQYLGGGTSGVW